MAHQILIGVRFTYDEGKHTAETLTMDYHRRVGVEVRIARIFNTYGPQMCLDDGCVVSNFVAQMDEEQWIYDSIMSEEVDMNVENEEDASVKVEHVDCFDAFNTSQLFASRDEVLHWARSVAHDIGFVVVIMSTYKTNRYKQLLLDIVGVTPTGMTFFVAFAYLEGKRVNNVAWVLQRFQGLFMRVNALPEVIVTDKDLSLINAIKTAFPDATNLLCQFHIDKNVKTKCKTLVAQKKAWDYVMEAWGSLVNCPCENSFDELKTLKWIALCGLCLWTMCVKHGVESAHWSLKRLLENSLGDICNVWEAMNNMMTLQHTQIKASFETSTHVVGHVFKVTLYKKLFCMISRYALNEIATEYEHVPYAGKNPTRCGCVIRSTHSLPCACELSKYVFGSIPLEIIHIFWRGLSFSDQGLCDAKVTITEEMETISKQFEQLDICGKVHLKTKLREIVYPDLNFMCPPPEKVKTKGAPKKPMTKQQRSTKRDPSYWEYVDALHSVQNSNSSVKHSASSSEQPIQRQNIPMLDQFHPCIQDSIENIIDVKADGNYGYQEIAALLGMGEESWSLVRNHLHKELISWSEENINLLSGIERFEELKRSLLVDGLSMVTMDKWINITDIGYVIASRYNMIVVSLS
ncbi:uncharacterized protein LOC114416008 [Glycine soja]|uniref:uncharacterized protein LOC114416008 n=1 Tax=Glycine soja TaxID=3848 RepID=UPI00103F2E89|nr:uncharacterized protein LOC114416008 [Glycine soja]